MRNLTTEEYNEVNGGILKVLIAIGKALKHMKAHPKTTLGGAAVGAGATAASGDE